VNPVTRAILGTHCSNTDEQIELIKALFHGDEDSARLWDLISAAGLAGIRELADVVEYAQERRAKILGEAMAQDLGIPPAFRRPLE